MYFVLYMLIKDIRMQRYKYFFIYRRFVREVKYFFKNITDLVALYRLYY